jgi:tRNA(Ile)-lysidine synthase
MRPLRDGVARPLLTIGRAQTRAMCDAAKIRPREDPSTTSLRFARNRVRLRVIPELERINPQVRAALARFADAAAEVEAQIPDVNGLRGWGRAECDVRTLPTDPALRERALADAWVAAGGITLSATHRAALVKLASTTDGSRRSDLPGGQAMREYARLFFVRTAAASRALARGATERAEAAAPQAAARGMGSVVLRRGQQVTWHRWRIGLDMPGDGSGHVGAVDAASAARLGVRSRRPGDRVATLGKLQDVFVDAKVPARARDTWPLVTLDDVVIWVPGVTPPPRSGRVTIAAGPVTDSPTNGEYPGAGSVPIRQVASRAEPRPRGGKRGRP